MLLPSRGVIVPNTTCYYALVGLLSTCVRAGNEPLGPLRNFDKLDQKIDPPLAQRLLLFALEALICPFLCCTALRFFLLNSTPIRAILHHHKHHSIE